MNKFLKDLEKELKRMKINENEIKEILADHEEMLNEAVNEGLSEADLESKFGDPTKLAKDLFEDSKNNETDVNEYVEEEQYGSIEGYTIHKSLVVDELKAISIKLISEDLSVYPYDGEQIEVHLTKVENSEKYSISLVDGVFEIKRKKSKVSFSLSFKSLNIGIVVRYPKQNKLDSYSVETVSGDCVVKGIETKELKLKSTSGDFEVMGVIAGKTDLTTVSGDFELSDMKLGNVHMSAVSGDFEGKDIKIAGEMLLNTVSGDFEFLNVSGESASFNSVSGDLEGKEFYVETISLKSVSGDIEIENSDKLRPINVQKKRTLSGDVNIR